jgi:hypothetical protein
MPEPEEDEDDELDEDEEDDDLDDDGDEDEHEKVTKADLLDEIADVLGEGIQDAAEVNVKDEDQAVLITMGDESVWKLTLRQVKEAP